MINKIGIVGGGNIGGVLAAEIVSRRLARNVALVDVGGQTHMVRVGNYLGQNFGRVSRITETETQLNEIVQDAAGEWVERPAKLELQVAAARAQGSKR